jgi:hypothetical protein
LLCVTQVDLTDPGVAGFEDEFSDGFPSSLYMDGFTRLFQYAARQDDNRLERLRFVMRENQVWEGWEGSNPIGEVNGVIFYLPASAEISAQVGGESRRLLQGLGMSNSDKMFACFWNGEPRPAPPRQAFAGSRG